MSWHSNTMSSVGIWKFNSWGQQSRGDYWNISKHFQLEISIVQNVTMKWQLRGTAEVKASSGRPKKSFSMSAGETDKAKPLWDCKEGFGWQTEPCFTNWADGGGVTCELITKTTSEGCKATSGWARVIFLTKSCGHVMLIMSSLATIIRGLFGEKKEQHLADCG